MISTEQKNIILETLKPFNPSYVGLFGSYARNEETKESDIDLVYDFKSNYSLFDLIDLQEALLKKLNKEVDLVSLRFMKPYFKKYIANDIIVLFDEKNK